VNDDYKLTRNQFVDIILDLPHHIHLKGDYIVLKPSVTEEQYWALANEDTNFELIDGVLVIHSPAWTQHEEIFRQLLTILSFYLEETNLGKVYGSRLAMRLSEKWDPEPDLMIVFPSKYDNVTETHLEGPADIVIEILSPATRELDLEKKIPRFLDAGVMEVWVIDPDNQIIDLISKDGTLEWTDPNSSEYLQSKCLPGLPLRIKWIWQRKEYPSNVIIREIIQLLEKEEHEND